MCLCACYKQQQLLIAARCNAPFLAAQKPGQGLETPGGGVEKKARHEVLVYKKLKEIMIELFLSRSLPTAAHRPPPSMNPTCMPNWLATCTVGLAETNLPLPPPATQPPTCPPQSHTQCVLLQISHPKGALAVWGVHHTRTTTYNTQHQYHQPSPRPLACCVFSLSSQGVKKMVRQLVGVCCVSRAVSCQPHTTTHTPRVNTQQVQKGVTCKNQTRQGTHKSPLPSTHARWTTYTHTQQTPTTTTTISARTTAMYMPTLMHISRLHECSPLPSAAEHAPPNQEQHMARTTDSTAQKWARGPISRGSKGAASLPPCTSIACHPLLAVMEREPLILSPLCNRGPSPQQEEVGRLRTPCNPVGLFQFCHSLLCLVHRRAKCARACAYTWVYACSRSPLLPGSTIRTGP